jgi:predicted MPP superfamily phosphohydrolase
MDPDMWLLVKLLAAVTLYSTAIEPRLVVRNDYPGPVPNLPAAWEGKQIALFADLQVGMWWANLNTARKVVRQVVEIRPAAVLIAGDFVYEADSAVDEQMREVVSIIHPLLDNRIPVYAVLGNHDYSLMNEGSKKENRIARRVRFVLDSVGVHMMDNRVVALTLPDSVKSDGGVLYLVGIGEKWAKNDSSAADVAKVPAGAPRIVFMHDPDSYADIPAGEAPLAMAAHTHGMQIGIPWVSDWLWRTHFSDRGSGVAGWIDHYGEKGNRLYINRGIGFSIVPARLNAPPELTVFTLTRAQPDSSSTPRR